MAFRKVLALFSIPPDSPRLPHLPIRQRKQNGVKAEYVLRREEEETSLKKSFNSQFQMGRFPWTLEDIKKADLWQGRSLLQRGSDPGCWPLGEAEGCQAAEVRGQQV